MIMVYKQQFLLQVKILEKIQEKYVGNYKLWENYAVMYICTYLSNHKQ